MVASDICVLNLNEEDLPKSSLSVVLVGTASDNSKVNDDKITLNLNAREYIDNQNNKSLLFNLYHFPNDTHLSPVDHHYMLLVTYHLLENFYLSDSHKLILLKILTHHHINHQILPGKKSKQTIQHHPL